MRQIAIILLALVLCSCGGGGGGAATPIPVEIPSMQPPPSPPVVIMGDASAVWLNASTLLWPSAPTESYTLFYSTRGAMSYGGGGFHGSDGYFDLSIVNGQLKIADGDMAKVKLALKGQVYLAQYHGSLINRFLQVQTAPVLDDLYASAAATATLGPSFNAAGVPTLRLWAPTAQSVKLNILGGPSVDMQEDSASGVWSYTAPNNAWTNTAYYTYSVKVYSRWTDKIETTEVTDPYSVSLDANSAHSFLADLGSAASKPAGWDAHATPALAHPADIALYELHVRDFSASDASVPAAHKGKYLAFTDSASQGMQHLKLLAKTGISHVHLLPTNDMASVNEDGCTTTLIPNAAPDSEEQQVAVATNKDADCFNWGYDPQHYNAPEGSYASSAKDGMQRIVEYRAMVQALHGAGLRVAMDVVYNHTAAAKQNNKSVLDKVVPGYYYRVNSKGELLADSCCADTAPENAMMGKLVQDSLQNWVRHYKIDSFRFDIMGMLPLALLQKIQSTLGPDVFLYGEGWNFGAVANDARFKQARQGNLAGSGIGSFNDRVRDTVRGGGCCDFGSALINNLGFINGSSDALRLGDLMKVGLAASLKDYRFTDRLGASKLASEIDYFGQGAGYTGMPQESINYVEAHDNQTLFDINAYKLPQTTSAAERVRAQQLGNALVLLAQGIPFIHAGQELLRSKSLERDSYNSGDWFNALDYSYQSNNFGVGLPSFEKNFEMWPLMRPILRNADIKPSSANILQARDGFLDLLAIRKDSSLFRLRNAQDIKERLSFLNTGPSQVPGVIAMHIDGANYPGANYKSVLVLFNVNSSSQTLALPTLAGKNYTLHPRNDAIAKGATRNGNSFTLPARSTIIYTE